MSAPPSKTRVSATADDALGTDDAVGVARRIASGEITASEAVEAAIARIQAVEPKISSVVIDRYDDALVEAAALRTGLFAGVPIAIKDNVDIAGMPTAHGSRAVKTRPMTEHSPVVTQILAAGAIPVAKSKLPEFGLTATTEFTWAEPARNPWNTDHSTGASSGGSAALTAAGAVPLAHANDGGGSIRIPASCCGLVGLKPSRNRLIQPLLSRDMPVDMAVEGVVTRSVRDTATFMAAAEQTHYDPRLPRVGHVIGPSRESLRIAMFTERIDGSPAHPDCVAAVEAVAARCEELGHKVEQIRIPIDTQFGEDFLLYWGLAALGLQLGGRFTFGRGFDRAKLEPLTKGLAKHCRRNLHRVPGAIRRFKAFELQYEGFFRDTDLLLSPTLAKPPVPIGELALDLPFDIARARLEEYASFTQAQNISGAPAISLPLARSADGLPVGVHFGAPYGHDRRLIELAFQLEEAMPWPQVWNSSD